MSHKDKYTGILDKNGVKIHNGDEVLVHHHNTYPKHPYSCKVIYKHGWKLKADKKYEGDDFDVYAWRKSIEVIKTDNASVFEFNSFEELKDKWFQQNIGFTITGEQRKLLYQCFDDAFKLGQEQLKQL